VPMKWPAKLFLVIAVLAGIYHGASREDHERWLAALRVSSTSAAKLRTDNERQKYLAAQAAEQARWRAVPYTQGDGGAAADTMHSGQDTCAAARARELQMKGEGREPDRELERMMLVCAKWRPSE